MKHLNIKYPIIQAPMIGEITTSTLVSEVSNAGGLGSYAGGYLKPSKFEADIKEILARTNKPFNVNLFVPEHYFVDPNSIQKAIQALSPIYNEFELTPRLPSGTPQRDEKRFNQQVEIIIKYKLPICSFSFGIPSATIVDMLKKANVYLIGTATTIEEAQAIEKAGMDAVVLQGQESGGPRSSFHQPPTNINLETLLRKAKEILSIPYIASGGIMTKSDVDNALNMGAIAVQLGTAFLLTNESGASEAYKNLIIEQKEENTVLTNSYSGKYGRGLKNKFIDFMDQQPLDAVINYPLQDSLTKSIRKVANKQNNIDYIALWCGINGYKGKKQSVNELIKSLTE